jgi:DeoR/GlpR family transcriptional regulator of sugar metabolism
MKANKKWTPKEELELDHLYSSAHLSVKKLAERFDCSVKEIRRKVKEMGIEQ